MVTPHGVERCDLLVEGERIAGLLEAGAAFEADELIDARGLVVLPGAIDAHTHFRQDDPDRSEPDPVEYEGFTAGGMAAAAGGTTTVVEMPQALPPTCDGATFARKRDLASRDAVVDFALWGGVVPGEQQAAGAIAEQVELGAVGFKAFLCAGEPLLPAIDDARMVDVLTELSPSGLMLGVHAENDALVRVGEERIRAAGRTDALGHAEARPPLVEIEAVSRAITLAEQIDGRVHIVHLSTPGAAELVSRARARGTRVTCETCPQYLALDVRDLARLRGFARCTPALRTPEEVEALWAYVADGTVDCVTSDHCGLTRESKEAGNDDIFAAPAGLPGVQTMAHIVIADGRARGLSWQRIAELLAGAPARLWRLAPRKGALIPGADADLMLVDPDDEWTLRESDLLHTHKWSPFTGRRMRGRVVRTLLRGRTVFALGTDVVADLRPGSGGFLPATPPGPGAA